MGLDQWMFTIPKERIGNMIFGLHLKRRLYKRDGKRKNGVTRFFDYHGRRYNYLFSWMGILYRQKGGKHSFNSWPMCVTIDDFNNLVTELEKYVASGDPDEYGRLDDADRKYLINVAKSAIAHIESGMAVVYEAWW